MNSDLIQDNIQTKVALLKSLANERRLAILCHLTDGEKTVTQILDGIHHQYNLSQSSLSQHLSRMKEDGVVNARRDSRNVYYDLKCDNVRCLLQCLHDMSDTSLAPNAIPANDTASDNRKAA